MQRIKASNLNRGLVGAWCPSVAGSGFTLPDLSGRGNHGTLTNMDADDWVGTDKGRALDFDGVDDHVAVLDNNALSPIPSMTVCYWAYPTAIPPATNGNRQWVLSKGNTNNFEYETSINSFSSAFGKFNFARYNLAATEVIARATASDAAINTWQHVCFSFAGQSVFPDAFYNGQSDNGTTVTAGASLTPANGTAQLQIGRRATNTERTWQGQLNDIRIYNRALSPSEIKQLYEGGPGYGLRQERKRSRFVIQQQFNVGRFRRQQLIGSGVY